MPAIKYVEGYRQGKLVLISRVNLAVRSYGIWNAECDCGRKIKVPPNALAKGKQDCGKCHLKMEPERPMLDPDVLYSVPGHVLNEIMQSVPDYLEYGVAHAILNNSEAVGICEED